MLKWYQIFPKYPWLSIYAWIVFCIFPFFFIFRSSSPFEIVIGLALNAYYFLLRIDFHLHLQGLLLYICVFIEIAISVSMTYLYGYIYFSIFLAFLYWKYSTQS